MHGNNWGDWLAQEKTKTPLDYIDTVYYAYDARLMADTLKTIRLDCLDNLGMADPPNPAAGFTTMQTQA